MKDTTRKAYTEVIEILKYFSIQEVKKIPEDKLKIFLKFRDKNYVYKVDTSKKFEDLDMMSETRAIFYILFEDYWASDEQRLHMKEMERKAFNALEEEKRKKYNPDLLFKDRKEEKTSQYIENVYLEKINEKWYDKFFKIIRNIFKKK